MDTSSASASLSTGEHIRAAIRCPLCGSEAKPSYRLEHATAFNCKGDGCSLQFAWPQLEDDALARAYELLYYPTSTEQAAVLQNASEFEVRNFVRAIETQIGPLCGKRLLDYGCGKGLLLRVAAEKGATVIGIEQSAEAREHCVRAGYGVAYSDLGEVVRNHHNAQFDYIIMCDVVEHLREPWHELSRLRSFLSPKGKVILTTPNADCLRSRISGSHWDQRRNLTHFYYFNRQALGKLLHRSGYSTVVELVAITEYSHHGPLRRNLQWLLARYGLQGGLLFMAGK